MVPYREVCGGDGDGGFAPADGRLVWGEVEEGAQAALGFGHRFFFERFSDGEQEYEGRGFADVAEDHGTDGADGHEERDADLAFD